MQRGLFWLRNYFKLNFESLYRVRMTHDVNKRDFVASRNSNSEHLLRLDTSWSSGEESNQKLGKTLLKKKHAVRPKTTWLTVTLDDINNHSEVKLAATLHEKQQIKKQQKNMTLTNSGNFVLRERLVDQKGCQQLFIRQTNVHYIYIIYVRTTGIEV